MLPKRFVQRGGVVYFGAASIHTRTFFKIIFVTIIRSGSAIGGRSYDFVWKYPKILVFISNHNIEAIKNVKYMSNKERDVPFSKFTNLINYFFIA